MCLKHLLIPFCMAYNIVRTSLKCPNWRVVMTNYVCMNLTDVDATRWPLITVKILMSLLKVPRFKIQHPPFKSIILHYEKKKKILCDRGNSMPLKNNYKNIFAELNIILKHLINYTAYHKSTLTNYQGIASLLRIINIATKHLCGILFQN